MKQVWTVGYEGRQIDDFVDLLKFHKIGVIADVRELPLSRKKGFSRNQLAMHLAKADIGYAHFKPLGTPKEIRDKYKSGHEFQDFKTDYLDHLKDQTVPMEMLESLLERQRCCLLCFEADPARCHRSVLADVLKERAKGQLTIHNILIEPA